MIGWLQNKRWRSSGLENGHCFILAAVCCEWEENSQARLAHLSSPHPLIPSKNTALPYVEMFLLTQSVGLSFSKQYIRVFHKVVLFYIIWLKIYCCQIYLYFLVSRFCFVKTNLETIEESVLMWLQMLVLPFYKHFIIIFQTILTLILSQISN